MFGKKISIGVPVCYNILNIADHLWVILRLHVGLGEILWNCTTRLFWGHLPALLLLAITSLRKKLGQNSSPKTVPWFNSKQHRPSLKRSFTCGFHVPHNAICFSLKILSKHCLQFFLGSNNRPLRIRKQKHKILWGRQIISGRRRKS